jgi:RNA polymerase sigma-70 factor (ECF subfamily)
MTLYDHALPSVYGYLVARCGTTSVAEDLTAETFLAAVDAVRKQEHPSLTVPWMIGVARHKLVDHWRRQAREQRRIHAVSDTGEDPGEDSWEAELDAICARDTLAKLAPHHRAVLTLRYLDDLRVDEVASYMNRTLHATEALLVRAKAAFRGVYLEKEEGDG